jgi:hypothetical protein
VVNGIYLDYSKFYARCKFFDLITRNTEEILTRFELERLVSSSELLRHYIGFEIIFIDVRRQ